MSEGAAALAKEGEVALGLAGALRAAGMDVPTGAVVGCTLALQAVGLGSGLEVYWAGRATLVVRPEDLSVYDRCFVEYFSRRQSEPHLVAPAEVREQRLATGGDDAPSTEGETSSPARASYSATEVLKERDFATLTDEERAEASALLSRLRLTPRPRRTRRRRSTHHHRDEVDLRSIVRDTIRLEGELRLGRYVERERRARRVVLLIDVSGSMESYSRALLRFAQVVVSRRRHVEAFTLGTRLTRVTRELLGGDADAALRRSVAAILDLSGGTRLGESLATFNSDFGVRGMARGAVVVIFSDGIDRGDPTELAAQLERLRRVAHRVIWVNPLKASPGYAPLARGMAAALEHVDEFVEGHSVAALAELVDVIDS